MAWLLATPKCRRDTPTKIQFPIFSERFDKNGAPSLKGKIEMFAPLTAQQIIEAVQPYNGTDPLRDMLWIIHDLDIKAKHRELPLTFTVFDLGSPKLNAIANFYAANPSEPFPIELAAYIDKHMNFSPNIAFSEFCKGRRSLSFQRFRNWRAKSVTS